MGGSPGRVPGLPELLWHTRTLWDSPGTLRVTVAYWAEEDLDGWLSRDSPGTVVPLIF